MHIEHGARLETSATLRCPRCGHRILLTSGARVPRCYCGGEEFDLQPARADGYGAGAYGDRHGPRAPEQASPP